MDKETDHKRELVKKYHDMEEFKVKKEEELAEMTDKVNKSLQGPNRVTRQCETIQKAVSHMEQDLAHVKKKIFYLDCEIQKRTTRRTDAQKLKTALDEKLEMHRQTIEQRELEVAQLNEKLHLAKAKNHDLITSKVEFNIQRKELESALRHKHDQLALVQKEYEALKRYYRKKQSIVESAKQMIPLIEQQARDEALSRERHHLENEEAKGKVLELRDELELKVAKFLQQEDLEKGKKEVCTSDFIHWTE